MSSENNEYSKNHSKNEKNHKIVKNQNETKNEKNEIILENFLLKIENESKQESKIDNLIDIECCNINFINLKDYIDHMEKIHENDDLFSDISDFESDSLSEENLSDIKENNITNYNQNRNFSQDEAAQSIINLKVKPYRCEIPKCNKSYTSAYGLRYHIENGHIQKDQSNKPYGCQFKDCNKRYKNTNGLKYHVMHCHISDRFKDAI